MDEGKVSQGDEPDKAGAGAHGAPAAAADAVMADGDYTAELDDLFEEMRRLVGFERPADRMFRSVDSESNAAHSNVGKEVTRHELRHLLRHLKLIHPLESQAELRALERKVKDQVNENADLTRRLKDAEARAKRVLTGEEAASEITALEDRVDVLQREVARSKKNEGQADLRAAAAREELRKMKRYARKLKHRLAEASVANDKHLDLRIPPQSVFKKKYEEQLAELRSLRRNTESLSESLEAEIRKNHDLRKASEASSATNKRLEAVVTDLRSELIDQHHLAVSKGLEARQARSLLETLESEYDEVKHEARTQNSTLLARIREMYDVQESMLQEIKKLQDNKGSPQIIRSLSQKAVQLRNLARGIFGVKQQRRLGRSGDATDSGDLADTGDVTVPAAGFEERQRRIGEDAPRGKSVLLTASSSMEEGVSGTAAQSGPASAPTFGEKARMQAADILGRREKGRKVSTYEANLERSKQSVERDVADLKSLLVSKDEHCEKLQEEVQTLRKQVETSEQRLEELRQGRVREARNFSVTDTFKAAEGIEKLTRHSRTQSLFA